MLGYDVVSGLRPHSVFAAGMIMRGNVLKRGFYRGEPETKRKLLGNALEDLTKLFECREPIGVFLAEETVGIVGDRTVSPSGFLINRDDLARMIAQFRSVTGERESASPTSPNARSESTLDSPIEGFEPDEIDFELLVAPRGSRQRQIAEGARRELQGYVAWLEEVRDTVSRENLTYAIILHRPSLMTFLHEFAHFLQIEGKLFGSRDSNEREAEARNWSHTVFFVMSPYQYKKALENRRFYHFRNLPLPPIGCGEQFVSFKQGLARWQKFFLSVFLPKSYLALISRGIRIADPEELARGMPDEFQAKVSETIDLLGLRGQGEGGDSPGGMDGPVLERNRNQERETTRREDEDAVLTMSF